MASNPESVIETTVEVVSEIPESVKQELKRKRKKLKEKKSKLSIEEKHYDLDTIEPDVGDEIYQKDKKLPPIHPQTRQLNVSKSADSWFSSEDDLSGFGQTYNQYTNEDGQPIPPPRKNKKSYELQDLTSFQSKSVDLSTVTDETPCGSTLVEVPNEVGDISSEVGKKVDDKGTKKGLRRKAKKETMVQKVGNEINKDTSAVSFDEISETDALDFFTKVWAESPEPLEDPSEDISQDDADSVQLIRKELQDKLTGADIVKYERASYTPFHIKMENEKNILFYPSSKPVPVHMKLPDGKEARSLADEGFYVGKKPFISRSNINRMENRFVTQKEFQWFGEDGCIKISPNPVCDNPVRHLYEGYGETSAEVEHVKAMVEDDKWRIKGDKDKKYQLDLDISSLSFLHHPLFSSEHVIESRVIQMYQKYICNEKKDIINTLKQRLRALRTAASNLKQSMQIGMEESSINNERLSRLKQYQNDIRQTKKIRDHKEEEQKNLWKSILNAWEELKTCRKNQEFVSTSLNLIIHKEKMNEEIEKEEFERELQDELEEEMEDYESCSEKLFEQYEENMKKWKEWNKAVKLAKKREKIRKKIDEKEPDEDEVKMREELAETKIEDEKILSEPEMPKPKPVAKFNSAVTLEKLRNNALKMRRKPGDPKLHIAINNDVPLTPTNQCPRAEMQRRNAVSKTKIYFKIMFNDKKVAETCKRTLTQDFKAIWGQIFKLQILHYPQTFKIEIIESGFFERYHMAELFIPIPTASQTALNAKLIDHQFSTEHVIAPKKNNAVGCGVPYKLQNGTETYLLMNGILKSSLVWGVSETGVVLVPDDIESPSKRCKKVGPLSHLKASKFSDIGKMKQWIKRSNLDPLNPENIGLFKLFQEMGLNGNNSVEDFSCQDALADPLDFCSMEEIENNKRFQLLQLRNQDISQFKNLVMIPPDEKDLNEDMLQCLNQKAESTTLKDIEDSEHAQREKAKLVMQKIREEVAKRFYVSQHKKMFEDVVIEEKVPSIGTIGFSLLKLLQPRRPLYPSRKERKKVTCTNTSMDVKIIIKIQHASNVPVRMDVDPIKQAKDSEYTTLQIDSQVQPFVEVMFQRMAVKTGIADGPHPTWNQELELPFRAPNDNYTPSSLETVKDVIYINLFDEVTVNLLEDDVEQNTVVYERLERRWLGNLKIPFTTLYLNSKIEGAFRINVPPVLLSYHNEPRPWLSGLSDVSENHTYLSFFMTIEPCLQLPEVFRDQGDSGECDKILYEVEKWQQSVIPRYPDRTIKLMSIDLNGEWIFISRFLHPLAPPEELLTANKESLETFETLARFVSLIPTVADSITFPGLCDIWSTSDQFLQMLIGDEEEHAILLCNYFLHLGKKAMFLLGSGIPEGPTAYVVTWEKGNDVWVWNASTGDHFSVRDNRNPLQSVGCLISPENVWANIQRNSHPSRINFDLSKTSEWKPFFCRGYPNPGLKTVQPSSLIYTPSDPEYIKKLQESLKNDLEESIIKWRQKLSTVWNNDCSKVLYKILTRLERNAGRTASDDSLQELEQILKTHKLNGFPLSMPYTDNEAVVETVFATGVHLTEDKNAEYSLAVYIDPYPCSILAVWVYVAVLIRRKTVAEPQNAKENES